MMHPHISLLIRLLKKYGAFFSDKTYLSILFKLVFKHSIDWHNPLTFNEKLNWLKVNYKNDACVTIVDKIEAKNYAASIIGNEYIIPTLQIWDNAADVSIETLPKKFVLKTNHDSGSVFVCQEKEKFNIKAIQSKLQLAMSTDFSKTFREWPYNLVPRKIFAEQYINDDSKGDLKDYKFFCFNGVPRFLKVDFDRNTNHRANYYSLSWNLLPFGEAACPPDPARIIEKIPNLNQMIELATKLSNNFPFVRVDFYNVNGKIYFGEMTLFPAAGFGHFVPETADLDIGHLLNLNHL